MIIIEICDESCCKIIILEKLQRIDLNGFFFCLIFLFNSGRFFEKPNGNAEENGKKRSDIEHRFRSQCIDDDTAEAIALCDEAIMDELIEKGEISKDIISKKIKQRKIFPCFFGSALKLNGVEEFIKLISKYTVQPIYDKDFSAMLGEMNKIVDKYQKKQVKEDVRIRSLYMLSAPGGEKNE